MPTMTLVRGFLRSEHDENLLHSHGN